MHTVSRQFTILGVSALSGMLIDFRLRDQEIRQRAGWRGGYQGYNVSAKVTEVDNRVRENSERIDATDKRAQQGIADAAGARGAAAAADTKATAGADCCHHRTDSRHRCTADGNNSESGCSGREYSYFNGRDPDQQPR